MRLNLVTWFCNPAAKVDMNRHTLTMSPLVGSVFFSFDAFSGIPKRWQGLPRGQRPRRHGRGALAAALAAEAAGPRWHGAVLQAAPEMLGRELLRLARRSPRERTIRKKREPQNLWCILPRDVLGLELLPTNGFSMKNHFSRGAESNRETVCFLLSSKSRAAFHQSRRPHFRRQASFASKNGVASKKGRPL